MYKLMSIKSRAATAENKKAKEGNGGKTGKGHLV